MLIGPHILQSFDKELSKVNHNLIKMTQMLIEELHMTLSYLKDNNQEQIFNEINEKEIIINNLHQNTLDLCLEIFTLRGPVASDLRYVFSSTHMSKILELNGDSIQKSIRYLSGLVSKDADLNKQITTMLEKNITMHNIALNAFIKKDHNLGKVAQIKDIEVDESFSYLCNLLLQKIQKKPEKLKSFYDYIFLAKNLELIADRISSIPKFIVFIATGNFDINH